MSTAALDLSGFVRSAVRYLRTYTPPEPAATAAAADNPGPGAAAGADVRSLCLQWMELMLIEKPHLLLLPDEQEQQQDQQEQLLQGEEHSKQLLPMQQEKEEAQTEEDPHDLLLQKQKPLVSAVLYTALTAEGAAAAAAAAIAASEGTAAPASVHDGPSRQLSVPTARDRETAAAAAAANHILRMALSVLTRFVQSSNANLRMVTEELLLLFNSNRRLLVRCKPPKC